jgi:phosphoglycolate phosphatase
MLRSTRAVVFDLDGTLVDSLPDIAAHLNAALVDHGLVPRTAEEIGEWVGYGAEQLVMRAVVRADLVTPVLATFRALYHARPVIHSRVFAGVDTALDTLAARYQLAVLSNKPHELTEVVTTSLLSRWPFAVIHGRRVDRPHKPDPRALHAVAAELGVDVRTCVLVGDSEVDIETARAAEAPSIAVSWGMRPLAMLNDARPDYLVHAPRELDELLRRDAAGSAAG